MIYIFAVVGLLLIAFGSLIVVAAPGDGQTGMVVFPLLGIGGTLGIIAIVRAWNIRSIEPVAIVVVGTCAAIAAAFVAWAIIASSRYSHPPSATSEPAEESDPSST